MISQKKFISDDMIWCFFFDSRDYNSILLHLSIRYSVFKGCGNGNTSHGYDNCNINLNVCSQFILLKILLL